MVRKKMSRRGTAGLLFISPDNIDILTVLDRERRPAPTVLVLPVDGQPPLMGKPRRDASRLCGRLSATTWPWRASVIRAGMVFPVLSQLLGPEAANHVVQDALPVVPQGGKTPTATGRDLTVVPVRPTSTPKEDHD